MLAFPRLEINPADLDPELLRRLPFGMALYYRALPLAQEDGSVTVVMEHPNNQVAVDVMERILNSRVVPVTGDAGAISAALQNSHPDAYAITAEVLAWSSNPAHSANVAAAATQLASRLHATVSTLTDPAMSAAEVAVTGSRGRHCATVVDWPQNDATQPLLALATTPLWLVRGAVNGPLRRLLVVLRGFASDHAEVEWAGRLVELGGDVTVMPLAGPQANAAKQWPPVNGQRREQIQRCLDTLHEARVQAQLKYRFGDPIDQIVRELGDSRYDLLIMAAEGDGAFVGSALHAIESAKVHAARPILVLRPAK
ncbi:MAG: hypothetical protein IPK16_09200 [Anaerolineales bacterium]|nr:hypothetical protein [Anaerolineales bacterium]